MSNANTDNLKDFLDKLTYEQIQLAFSESTFYKGLKYYEQKRVESASLNSLNELLAIVHGNLQYKVKIEWVNQVMEDECSCPIGGSCKHVVAVLLHCANHLDDIVSLDNGPSTLDFNAVEQYLQTLNKPELIKLVLQYAPENFMEYVTIKDLKIDQSKKLFDKVARQIDALFGEDELLYDPHAFEGALVTLLEKLKGVWEKLPDKTGDLIISIMDKIGDLMHEGYLYDHYYDNEFEGYTSGNLFRTYIYSLPFEAKMKFILRASKAISQMDYSCFDLVLTDQGKLFTDKEKPFLKDYFLKNIATWDCGKEEDYYKLLFEDFSTEEREFVLRTTYLTSEFLTLELAKFYKSSKKEDEAIQIIETYLKNSSNAYSDTEGLYTELLQLKNAKGKPIEDTAIIALNEKPTVPLLELVVKYLPEKQKEFEQNVRKKSPQNYLDYLEKQKRIKEAVQLLGEGNLFWDETKHKFFVKYWKECPEEAKSFFINRIDEELNFTGDSHYYAIANSLRGLKKIDREEAILITKLIRTEYKRRRNLMEAIKDL